MECMRVHVGACGCMRVQLLLLPLLHTSRLTPDTMITQTANQQHDNNSYDDRSGAYVPHAKDVIKQRTQQHLSRRTR